MQSIDLRVVVHIKHCWLIFKSTDKVLIHDCGNSTINCSEYGKCLTLWASGLVHQGVHTGRDSGTHPNLLLKRPPILTHSKIALLPHATLTNKPSMHLPTSAPGYTRAQTGVYDNSRACLGAARKHPREHRVHSL